MSAGGTTITNLDGLCTHQATQVGQQTVANAHPRFTHGQYGVRGFIGVAHYNTATVVTLPFAFFSIAPDATSTYQIYDGRTVDGVHMSGVASAEKVAVLSQYESGTARESVAG